MQFVKTILLASLLFLSQSCFSQVVNIENKRIYDDTGGWSGRLAANFSAIQTITTLYNLGVRPLVQYKDKKNNLFFIADLSYVASKEQTFSNLGMLHVRYARRIKQSTWKIETYVQAQYNEFQDQQYRVLGGMGLRNKFFDKKGLKMFFGVSALVEQTRLISDSSYLNFTRNSNYLSFHYKPNDQLTLTGATYLQPVVTDLSIYNLSGQYIFLVKLWKKLDWKIEYNHFLDTRNQDDYNPFQQNFLTGIVLSL